MARPVTGWAGPAVVNGVLAIVLLVWLADGTSRGAKPEPVPPDPVGKPAEVPAVHSPPGIVLPPPPRPAATPPQDHAAAPVSPRPPAQPAPEPPMEIVPLRPAAPDPPNVDAPMHAVQASKKPEDRTAAAPADRTAARRAEKTMMPAEAPVRVDAKAVRTGRQLLRIFEHGDGPGIEIAWPAGAGSRARLHEVLNRCFGMRLALIDRAGALYLDDGPAGRPWPIDLDRFSGFVRRPNGRMTAAERGDARRIARHHRGLTGAEPVRLFPRQVDAALLGGLAGLSGEGYRGSRSITAAYRLRNGRVTVGDVRIDGRGVAGEIDLSRVAAPACRRRGRT